MVRVVFMGTPEFSVPVLERLIDDKNLEVVGVVSQPDRKVGRKREVAPSPVSLCALNNNIPLFRVVHIREEYQEILDTHPDIIITCAYGQIIPDAVLFYPKFGSINVHASLLPKYRGGAPIEASIMNGDKETGITIMYMDSKMDHGDIIKQRAIPILESDNQKSLREKLSLLGRDLLMEVLPTIFDGTNDRIKQDELSVTYAYNITREDEHLLFHKSAREVFNHVRALSPKPGCFVKIRNKTMKIYDGYILEEVYSSQCGEVVSFYPDGIGVQCLDFVYVITDLKMEGKKRCLAKDYMNGAKNLIGEVYE